jgi:glycosyltransferase involved in cell wall biosynthesis
MKIAKTWYIILCFALQIQVSADTELPLVIITASYNNQTWCKAYIESLIHQNYTNWRIIYINDCSTDETLTTLLTFIEQYNLHNKITLINNPERKGHLYNQYHAIHSCNTHDIIIIVDGDDWLAHNDVFKTINHIYTTHDIWITYGQFLYCKKNKKGFCRPIPPDVIAKNGIRDISWRTSHLRTFYAGLFQQIRLEDLLYQGSFFPKCADVATMFPMLEMAGTHFHFIPDILYIYNDDNPLSYHHDPTHQRELESYIRTLPRYTPLEKKVW